MLQIRCKFVIIPSDQVTYGSSSLRKFKLDLNFMIDIISLVPFCYLFLLIKQYAVWLRCIGLLKIYRLFAIYTVIRNQFKTFHFFNIIILSFVFLISSHMIACILYQISLFESKRGGRFDGLTFVSIKITIVFYYNPIIYSI